jgi:hypothetical protein
VALHSLICDSPRLQTEVDFKLKPATVGLTDNDNFHLLVRLTRGGAREQLGLLQETLLQEVKGRNEPVQREYERTLLTYQRELAAYEALTEEEQAEEEQPEPPVELVLSDSFIQPVARFENCWKTFTKKGQRLGFQNFGTSR